LLAGSRLDSRKCPEYVPGRAQDSAGERRRKASQWPRLPGRASPWGPSGMRSTGSPTGVRSRRSSASLVTARAAGERLDSADPFFMFSCFELVPRGPEMSEDVQAKGRHPERRISSRAQIARSSTALSAVTEGPERPRQHVGDEDVRRAAFLDDRLGRAIGHEEARRVEGRRLPPRPTPTSAIRRPRINAPIWLK
jgi:hypothetical protein